MESLGPMATLSSVMCPTTEAKEGLGEAAALPQSSGGGYHEAPLRGGAEGTAA